MSRRRGVNPLRFLPLGLALTIASCSGSCNKPITEAPIDSTTKPGTRPRATPSFTRVTASVRPGKTVTTGIPSPVLVQRTPDPSETGTGLPGVDPTPDGTPPGSPEANLVLDLVETTGSWALGPFLTRPRAGLAAAVFSRAKPGTGVPGATEKAIVVAEGDHRPSLEVIGEKDDIWKLDASYDQENTGPRTDATVLHQGVLFTAWTGYQDELITAGGLAGQRSVLGAAGTNFVYSYRKGAFSARRANGAYFLDKVRWGAVAGVANDKMVVAGGENALNTIVTEVEALDLKNKPGATNVKLPAMPLPVAGASGVGYKGKFYVFGGYTYEGSKTKSTKTVQMYDATANKWSKDGAEGAPPELPVALNATAATLVSEASGLVYLFGGIGDDNKPVDTVYSLKLSDANPKWESLIDKRMPTPRAAAAAVSMNDQIWVMGGFGPENRMLRTVEIFTP